MYMYLYIFLYMYMYMHIVPDNRQVRVTIYRPAACKDLHVHVGMQLEIIARDITTGCSGCLH